MQQKIQSTDTSSEVSTQGDLSHVALRAPPNGLLSDLNPHNVSYFKKYASYMNRNSVKPLEANGLVAKVRFYVVPGLKFDMD